MNAFQGPVMPDPFSGIPDEEEPQAFSSSGSAKVDSIIQSSMAGDPPAAKVRAFGMGVGTPEGLNEVDADITIAKPTGESRQSGDSITEFFQGFGDGFTDAATLGLLKTDLGGEGIAGTAGEVTGFIAGEVPYWLIGAGVTKWALKGTVAGLKLAAKAETLATSSKYGKRVVSKVITGGAPADAVLGTGLEAGRRALGDEEAFTPGRVALQVAAPFVPALFARAKNTVKAADVGLTQGSGKYPSFGLARNADGSIDELAELDPIKAAFDRLPDSVKNNVNGFEDLFTMKFVHAGERKALKDLYDQGAPTDDILALIGYETDEIAEAAALWDRRAWQSNAVERAGKTDDFNVVLDSYDGAIRSVRDEPVHIAMDMDVLSPFHPQARIVNAAAGEVNPLAGLDSTLLQYVRRSDLSGAAGGGRPLSALDIKLEHKILDRMKSITFEEGLTPPRGLRNRMWDTIQENVPFTRRYLSSVIRSLEGMGGSGQELARLLDKTRLWHTRNAAHASSDISNSMKDLTPEDVLAFTKAALGEEQATNESVKKALSVWNVHRGVLGDYYQQHGGTLRYMNADGEFMELPINGLQGKHYFPMHTDDPEKMLKDPKVLALLAEEMTKRADVPHNMGGSINAQGMQEMLLNKLRKQRRGDVDFGPDVPGASGFKGDPNSFPSIEGLSGRALSKAKKAQERWAEEVRESLVMFMDNNYEAVSKQRHLGTPQDFSNYDSILTQESIDSRPLQHALKARFDEVIDRTTGKKAFDADEALELGVSQEAVDELTKAQRIAAFGDLKGVKKAAIEGDELAQEFINESAKNLGHLGSDKFGKNVSMIGWGSRAEALVKQIGLDGNDDMARYASDAIETFLGYKTYSARSKAFSQAVRDYQTVTKLGLAVIENTSQSAFTATRFGFKATYKALRDDIFNRDMSRDFAEQSGALLGDVLRSIEIEAGTTWSGEFLRRTGFATIERMNRRIGANAGKHFMLDNMAQISRNPKGIFVKDRIRLLKKMGFQMEKIVSDKGEITEYGFTVFDRLKTDPDGVLSKVLKDVAGFEGAAGTQFLSDALDTPLGLQTPYGKIWGQFKSFAFNGARAMNRDIIDEIRHGNPMPAIRMLVLGAAVGEVTQNARMIASGRDPRKRGQQGIIREIVGKVNLADKDDKELITILGQSISGSDLASRVIENVIGVGYAGAFVSLAQSSMSTGKLGIYGFLVGPTIDEAASIAGNVTQGVMSGNFEPLARRALREGGALIGSIPGVRALQAGPFSAAFGGSALGRQAQLAIAPSEAQMESSLFVTEEEAGHIAVKSVVENYNNARAEARKLAGSGDNQAAIKRMQEWNSGMAPRVRMLRDMNALNMNSFQRISFSIDDMRRTLLGGAEDLAEPSILETAGVRASRAFPRLANVAGNVAEGVSGAFQ